MSSQVNNQKSDEQFFKLFSELPRDSNPEVLMGSHRFLSYSIKNKTNLPSGSTLIKIFMVFAQEGIKEYVFRRMKKQILLELALCLVQDLISADPKRAAALEIRIEQCNTGVKKAVIATSETSEEQLDDEFPLDPTLDWESIDEAVFCLHDRTGTSPDSKFVSGQGKPAPYAQPDENGSFTTPKKPASVPKAKRVTICPHLNYKLRKFKLHYCKLSPFPKYAQAIFTEPSKGHATESATSATALQVNLPEPIKWNFLV